MRPHFPIFTSASLALVAALGVAPARASVTVGPEVDLSPPGSSIAGGYDAAIATDGSVYLVVWTDGRASPFGTDIFATRVDASGTVLDPTGIAISRAPYRQNSPRVAFDGESFVVVWQQQDDVAGSTAGVLAARVRADGTVLDPAAITLTSAEYEGAPYVVTNAEGSLVVWRRPTGVFTTTLVGARLSRLGVVLDDPFPITTGADPQLCAAPVPRPDGYLLVCAYGLSGDRRVVRASRLDATGRPVAATATDLVTTTWFDPPPLIAVAGRESTLVAWARIDTEAVTFEAVRLGADGRLLDAVPIELASEPWDGSQSGLDDAVALGDAWLVGWSHGEGSHVARVAQSDGRLVSPATAAPWEESGQAGVALGSTAAGGLVTWNGQGAYTSFRASLLDAGGDPVGAPFALGTPAVEQHAPAVAASRDGYLVAWREGPEYGISTSIAFTRVESDGVGAASGVTRLELEGVRVSAPAVASDSDGFLIAWTRASGDSPDDTMQQMVALRVGADGGALDAPIVLDETYAGGWGGPWFDAPRVAFDGHDYLVAWTYSGMDLSGAIAARVSRDGSFGPVAIPGVGPWDFSEPHLESLLGVAGGPMRALALFGGREPEGWAEPGLYGVRYENGARIDDPARRLGPLRAELNGHAALGGSPTAGWLALWTRTSDPARWDGPEDLEAVAIDPTGIAITTEPRRWSGSAPVAAAPAVAFDGNAWIAVWRTGLGGPYVGETVALRLDTSARWLDGSPLPLWPGDDEPVAPVVASIGDGSALIVTERFDPEPPFGAVRIRARRVVDDGVPTVPVEPLDAGVEGEATDGGAHGKRAYGSGCMAGAAAESQPASAGPWLMLLLAAVWRCPRFRLRRARRPRS